MTMSYAGALRSAFDKLTAQLITKEDELHRRENSSGTAHDVAKMNRLREEIESLNVRIERTLNLMERNV